jgi:hypothetical protein
MFREGGMVGVAVLLKTFVCTNKTVFLEFRRPKVFMSRDVCRHEIIVGTKFFAS